MKKLLLILFVIIPFLSFSQTQTPDTVFTKDQVLRIGNYIDSLERVNNINQEIILQQAYKTNLLQAYSKQDSMLIGYQNQEIDLLRRSLKIQENLTKVNKKRWIDSPLIWFALGVGTIYLSSEVVSNVK